MSRLQIDRGDFKVGLSPGDLLQVFAEEGQTDRVIVAMANGPRGVYFSLPAAAIRAIIARMTTVCEMVECGAEDIH